jgi:IS1 family transposase
MGWSLVAECTAKAIQELVDRVPKAFQFCSDGYASYRQVNYRRSRHLVAHGKSQTYSVEANNAELRCFVSQLVRRTRGFAKCEERAITLFVHCWNARQMFRQHYSRYRRGLSEFISP